MKKEYYLKNKDAILEKNRIWKLNHQDKIKEQAKTYRKRRNELEAKRRKSNKEKRQAEQKAYHKRHPQKAKENSKRWRIENKEKLIHYKIHRAIKSGKLNIQNVCKNCGSNKNVLAHHHDYSKPLDVIWLCKSCHAKLHIVKPMCG